MFVPLCTALVVLVMLCVPTMAANTYYVSNSGSDSNPCVNNNSGAPKQHIMGANGGARCLSSGDTLLIRGGNYNESLDFAGGELPSGGGTWETATRIAAYPGEQVALTATGAKSIGIGAGVGWSWLIFDGIEMYPNGRFTGGPVGVFLGTDTHHIRFVNCFVTGGNKGFEVASGGHHHEFINNRVTNSLWYGWYAGPTDSLWEGNEIYDNDGYGLHIYASGTVDVDRNTIRRNYLHGNGFLAPPGGNGNIIIATGEDNKVYNNIIVGNFQGVQIGVSCVGCWVYNNTIVGNQDSGIVIESGSTHDQAQDVANPIVRNNILWNNDNPISNSNPPGTVVSDNLINTNPQFDGRPGSEYKLTAGSTINTGHSMCTGTTDFYGQARPLGTACDIGAAEFTEGGGGQPPTGNPIYVAATGGTPTTDCITAESQATPIRTIAGGLACMNAVAGKIMYIKAGTYTECIDTAVLPIKGGNGPGFANATIIQSFSTDLVTIRPATCPQNTVLYMHNGANDSFIVFRGSSANRLTIDGVNNTNGVVLYEGMNNIRFEFVDVVNTTAFEGLYGYNVANISLVDSFVHGAKTSGVAFEGTNTGLLVERSQVYTNGTNTTHHGIKQEGGTTSGLTIKESRVSSNTGKGIAVSTSTGSSVQNSLIYFNGAIGLHIQTGASGFKSYNNTIALNTGNGFQCDTGATSTEIKNTVVFGNTAGNLVNNCGAVVAANLCAVGSADCAIGADPLFVNSGAEDFRLADNSQGINNGVTLLSVTTAYDGVTRPQGIGYDIGAYERDQAVIPSPDVTVMKLAPKQASMFFD